MNTEAASGTVHIFERNGLGKAPYRVIGFSVEKYQACQGAPIQPAGSCDYCGQGIMLQFRIKSADGRTFKVGSDCVMKTSDERMKQIVKAKVSAHNSARTAERNAEKIATLTEQLADETIRAKLRVIDHPMAFRGSNLLNYAEWIMLRAGTSGKLKLAKTVAQVVDVTYGQV